MKKSTKRNILLYSLDPAMKPLIVRADADDIKGIEDGYDVNSNTIPTSLKDIYDIVTKESKIRVFDVPEHVCLCRACISNIMSKQMSRRSKKKI